MKVLVRSPGRDAFTATQWMCTIALVFALTGCVRSEDGLGDGAALGADDPATNPPVGAPPSDPPADMPPDDPPPMDPPADPPADPPPMDPPADPPPMDPPADPPMDPPADPPPMDPPADPPPDDMPPPVEDDPPVEPPVMADVMVFEQTLFPALRDPANFCVGCHGALQIPTFAVADVQSAYNVILTQQKVDLDNPALSRVYLRAAEDRHNCGGEDSCDAIAAAFLAGIQAWAAEQPTPEPLPASAAVSASATFADTMEGGVARVEDAVIALYTFDEGSGDVAMDTSGVGAPLNLQLEGMTWEDGGGLRNVSGKAEASEADSRKLFDMIMPGGAYSVEAWVLPDNTAQDGPARIVSYSIDTQTRNFTLGQNAIYYQLRNRSAGTGINGTPALEALDPQTATAIQHVVATFDPAVGPKVFVNGMLSIEDNSPDTLAWTDDQRFVLGNEVTNNRLWQGVFRLVAVHNRALDGAEVAQNFEAGFTATRIIRFDVAEPLGAPAYVEMLTAQIDATGYLFAEPKLVTDVMPVAVKNVRVAVNGSVPVAAQAFRRVDTTVTASGTLLSPLGAVVPVALGAEMDSFHLEFEVLGNATGTAEAVAPPAPPAPAPDVDEPDFGMRSFSQVNDTMAELTGVDPGNNRIRSAFDELLGALPATNDLQAFTSAQQVAIQRLARAYCGEVVGSASRCADLFGSCSVAPDGKDAVGQQLYGRFVGQNLASQPPEAAVVSEITGLIDGLGCTAGCDGATAQTVLNASCAAVLASGATTIH